MTEEKINYYKAAAAVAKMADQLATLRMQMPANLAFALQVTAKGLETAQAELNEWYARLRQQGS